MERAAIDLALTTARVRSCEVTLTGGEPTLRADLDDIVRAARALGFDRVGIQTNGRRPERMRPLVAAGLTDVHLSIHGGVAAAHDYHTGIPGSFTAASATLSEARALGIDAVVTTVLTRSNARSLAETARLVIDRRASAWCLAVPRIRGRAAEHFDRIVPRLGIVIPFALHAMQVAIAAKIPVFVRGAPLCLLGPFAKHSLAEEGRAFGEACEGCAARPSCPGVEPTYLRRFAGDELSANPKSSAAELNPIARLFVGPGELAPAVERVVAEAPAAARVALPMLGKVQPAREEVPRAVEKKSGPALRELFKELFVEKQANAAGERAGEDRD